MRPNPGAGKTRPQHLKVVGKVVIDTQPHLHASCTHRLDGSDLSSKLIHMRTMRKMGAGLRQDVHLVIVYFIAVHCHHIRAEHAVRVRKIKLGHAVNPLNEVPLPES